MTIKEVPPINKTDLSIRLTSFQKFVIMGKWLKCAQSHLHNHLSPCINNRGETFLPEAWFSEIHGDSFPYKHAYSRKCIFATYHPMDKQIIFLTFIFKVIKWAMQAIVEGHVRQAVSMSYITFWGNVHTGWERLQNTQVCHQWLLV